MGLSSLTSKERVAVNIDESNEIMNSWKKKEVKGESLTQSYAEVVKNGSKGKEL